MKFEKTETQIDRIRRLLEEQGTIYLRAKYRYGQKEAERKHFESSAIKAAEGKSFSEKQMNAQASKEWLEFHKELNSLSDKADFEKFKYDLLDKDWLAAYQDNKMNDGLVKRQGA